MESGTACSRCGAMPQAEGERFCGQCGNARAISGNAEAGAAPTGFDDSAATEARLTELEKQSNNAASALRIVAIVYFISAVVTYFTFGGDGSSAEAKSTAQLMCGLTAGVGVLFLVLNVWSRRNPLPAVASGLVVYATLIVLNALADPATLAKGLLLKIIILYALVRGLKAAIQYRAMQQASIA